MHSINYNWKKKHLHKPIKSGVHGHTKTNETVNGELCTARRSGIRCP